MVQDTGGEEEETGFGDTPASPTVQSSNKHGTVTAELAGAEHNPEVTETGSVSWTPGTPLCEDEVMEDAPNDVGGQCKPPATENE